MFLVLPPTGKDHPVTHETMGSGSDCRNPV